MLVEYVIDRYARKARKNSTHINKETLGAASVVVLAGKHTRITEGHRAFDDTVRNRHFLRLNESWVPQQPLPATEPKHPIELPRRLIAQEMNMIEAALRESRGPHIRTERGRRQVGHTAVDPGIED